MNSSQLTSGPLSDANAMDGMPKMQPPLPPRPKKRRKTRDLSRAVFLRPHDVYALYGIPECTLSQLCHNPDPAHRLPYFKIVIRSGTRGICLFDRKEFEAWLSRWEDAA